MYSNRTAFFKSIIFSWGTKVSLLVTGVLYTYLIANYLGPADYGIVSYYIALIGSIITVSGISFLQGLYNLFISRSRSKSFFIKVLRWQYYLAVTLFVFVFVFSEKIALFFHKEEFLFLRWAAFLLLLLPLHDSFMFLFRSFKLFGKVLKVEVVVSFMNLCLAFFLVVSLSFGIYGVIYARIISIVVGILVFAWFFRCLRFRNRIVDMVEVKTYSYSAFMVNLFRSAGMFSFTIFLGMFLSPAMLGMFYIAQKFVGYIVSSFQASINEALIPFVAESYKDTLFLNKYMSYSIKLSLIISIFSVVLFFLVGRPLLMLFFPGYVSAYYVIVLYGIVALLGSFNVLNSAYMSQNRMDLLARVYFSGFVVIVIFSFLLMPSYGVYGAIFTLWLCGIVQGLFCFYYLKDLGLSIDFIIRLDDVKYFFGLFRFFCKRLLNAHRQR